MPPFKFSHLSTPFTQIGSYALFSRILGFLRDLVIAQLFGANANTDAFFIAFKLPNLTRRLFAEGAFAVTLVPLFTAKHAQHGDVGVRSLLANLSGTLTVSLFIITVLGSLAAPLVIFLLAPGVALDPQRGPLAIDMLYLTLPYLILIGLTALLGAVLNTYQRFVVPALAPALLNISLISCAFLIAPHLDQPIFALAWGVLIAGIAQVLIQLPALIRLNLLSWPRFHLRDPLVRTVLTGMGPNVFGVAAHQVNLLLASFFASLLASGSISWLYYAERLLEFPLGILGSALGTAIVPLLAHAYIKGSAHEFHSTLDQAVRWILFLGMPATAGLCLLAVPIIALLFHSEHFNDHDVLMAGYALMAYALGVIPLLAIKVLAPACYSRGDAQTPIRIAVLTVGCHLVLSAIFIWPLGHAGLALSVALASLFNAVLLLRAVLQSGAWSMTVEWWQFFQRIVVATLIMIIWLWLMMGSYQEWLQMSKAADSLRLLRLIIMAILIYLGTLFLIGVRPRHLWQRQST
ncbi:murein biosynthesis integral membrane protein MurJ [Thiospirillum jenense]|uniref:Probable lipid II flippase MurJ n=1 Tax=Thiospirillum jenense TaxID=1653858 RepID=A0A839H7I6_9GAMM|nr:murein biosynthesis integral membrane protein MurJ [Thiospirillum jenense]MBB1125154.1 murein biosynthesis integral membrane protein MurJ [Thiospirillum jenense]